ncbi:hypothetical protein BGW36DRAFT_367945 [Talaromyces proteolyticus]|uniref:Uncharacterized protein n=1 Tax=Talaromyces proteolyticus TaxID=1131652 RepID=A0AAD4Q6F2_9EURO|nr:uncharacterized protein BGW36DRAFT_367945 [Talaromyces proteolyticus]KAH8705641.1 hypothetical protein BGW36DRAFT_367945 [Talaromyces proteolyticus]
MSRLRGIRLNLHSSKPTIKSESSSDAAWSPIGLGNDKLRGELEELYWKGVENELENIVRTLEVWQRPEFADVTVPDEKDDFIHGFDTFINQVSQEAREFALSYDLKGNNKEHIKYPAALQEVVIDRKAEYISSKIKSSVRKTIDDLPNLSGIEKRAWMLLQATGFLDIEKFIEHQPLAKKKPAIPQLDLSCFDQYGIPQFRPMHCARPDCNAIISGSMFTSRNRDEPRVICEDCYWHFYYGKESYSKSYKHCILPEVITPEVARKICHCQVAGVYENDEKPPASFPISKNTTNHAKLTGHGAIVCDLLRLKDIITDAKYEGIEQSTGAKRTTYSRRLISKLTVPKIPGRSHENMSNKHQAHKFSKVNSTEKSTTNGNRQYQNLVTDPYEDTDIPHCFRKHAEKDPFGEVHMALRVGPLIIENGVVQTKKGALITLREAPVFHQRSNFSGNPIRNLAITGSRDRALWQQVQPSRKARNYKAVMKQVVGAPFSGLLPFGSELDIVREILIVSKSYSEKDDSIQSGLGELLKKAKTILQSRVTVYLDVITDKLLSPETCLIGDGARNSHNTFCNSLINHHIFEPLVHGPNKFKDLESEPLYLMSFVCPDEGYMQPKIRTKFDVPNGLTQEYLLRLYFGRHNEADIIDTYQEYWYDWGAFGGPLYRYQDLFPWDCTEAYGRYPVCCGECNLSKHIWAFPFDSWSMVSHHLARDQNMYAPDTLSKGATTIDTSTSAAWMRNRLNVLSASALLCRAAAAMSKTDAFRKTTAWLHSSGSEPRAGLRALQPSLARVKLGGIHRAQPYSHYFEAGNFDQYFLAEWALWPRSEQIEAYEKLRNERMNLKDISSSGVADLPSKSGGIAGRFQFSGNSKRKSEVKRDTWTFDSDDYYTNAGFPSQTPGIAPGAGCAVTSCGSKCGTGCGNISCGGSACGSRGDSSSGGGGGGSSSCGGSSSSGGGGGSSCGGSSSCGGGSSCGSS